MLEINCSHWINNYDLTDFSNSIAMSGDRLIAHHTWENACSAILDGYRSGSSSQQIITSTATRRQMIDYFKEFGAWTYNELNTMSNIQLSALALQYIAGNYREDMTRGEDLDNENYQSGYFYRNNGDIYTTLSS